MTQTAKARVLRNAPDVLLTTPESLEAILVSTRTEPARLFNWVRFVICDELHAFGGDDRGWHLLSLLRRIGSLIGFDVQRIGLSATVGNPESLLEWFCGGSTRARRVIAPTVVGPSEADVQIDYVGNLENAALVLTRLYRGEKRLVFSDSRSRAENLASHLLAAGVETFVSHSSLSKEERHRAERAFADRRDCVIVATSTLELGIDVGDLDRVIQLDAPSTVSSFLQRLGRTGRRPDTRRNCLFLTTNAEALLRAAAIEELWREGFVEPTKPPDYPVHVTAQQLLTVTLQHRRIPKPDLVKAIAHLPEVPAILECMLERGFLAEDVGMIAIGPEAERIYGGRNYMEVLSVFDSPLLFTVFHGNEDLGAVYELSFQRKGDEPAVLLLGGRAWRVRFVDYDKHVAFVEPTEDRGRSLWLGSSQPLSYRLCQAMRRVLLHDQTNPSWSRRAGVKVTELRQPPLITAPDATVLVETNPSSCTWWTFAGLHGNAALDGILGPTIKTTFDNLSLKLPLSAAEFGAALKAANPNEVSSPETTPPKFAACLPASVLRNLIQVRGLDRDAALVTLQAPVCVNSTK